MNQHSPKQHIENLQSLRGIAAVMVALSHCLIVFPINGEGRIWDQALSSTLSLDLFITRFLLVFCNGSLGVLIFFILSGYVLAFSFQKYQLSFSATISFYIRRIFRIYPLHIVWILLIVCVLSIATPFLPEKQTAWGGWNATFNAWPSQITLEIFLRNLLLIETDLNALAWTLHVEIIMSAAFPIIYFLNHKGPNWVRAVVAAWFIGMSAGSVGSGDFIWFYMAAFNFGVLGATTFSGGGLMLRDKTTDILISISTTMLFLLNAEIWDFSFFTSFYGKCACILSIIFCLSNCGNYSLISKLFSLRFFRFMGAVSYSFYLQHLFILYLITSLMVRTLTAQTVEANSVACISAAAISSVALTTFIAKWSYFNIEKQGIKLGSAFMHSLYALLTGAAFRFKRARS